MNPKYDHFEVESKLIGEEAFQKHDLTKPPFGVIIPPPNVTGKLHLGHALDSFLPDTIIRFKKLYGYDTYFAPGFDHAGIATESKVSKVLKETKNLDRSDLTKEEFIGEIKKWNNQHQKEIIKQWKRLGIAFDYSKINYTFSLEFQKLVSKVFVKMANDNLIYRHEKPINWDPKLKTALSDVEVINKTIKQKMYYVKYFFENSDKFCEIATTRPETIFSDVAIGFHPDDKRYHGLESKFVINPLTGKSIPIIKDQRIEIDKGSGLMKISAHALKDIEIINDHPDLKVIECIDDDGKLNGLGLQFEKLSTIKAREEIAKSLEEKGFLIKAEEIESSVGFSERSQARVEILIRKQWFVKMKGLAQKVLDSIKADTGDLFSPPSFGQNLKNWIKEIRDWTISRQIEWGHKIPAWYKGQEIKISIQKPGPGWVQDPDVLDTWFSSALAPFAFFDSNLDQDFTKSRYFPNAILSTGKDLVFFWVFRMYFQSLYLTNQVPFKHVLFHGIIRNKDGQKLSKSLANNIDLFELINKNGSDALRLYLISAATLGKDFKFSEEGLRSSWNLINKLWNSVRFILANYQENASELDQGKYDIRNWIESKIRDKSKQFAEIGMYEVEKPMPFLYTLAYNYYNFSDPRDLVFTIFSGVYIEYLKTSKNKVTKKDLRLTQKLLILLYPYMPYVSSYLFDLINKNLGQNSFISEQDWPWQRKSNSTNSNVSDFGFEFVYQCFLSIKSEWNTKKDITAKIKKEFYIKKPETGSYESKDWDKFYDYLKIFLASNGFKLIKIPDSQYIENNNLKDFYYLSDYQLIYIKEVNSDEVLRNLVKNISKFLGECQRSLKLFGNQNYITKAPQNLINKELEKFQDYFSKLQFNFNNLLKTTQKDEKMLFLFIEKEQVKKYLIIIDFVEKDERYQKIKDIFDHKAIFKSILEKGE